MKIIKRVSYAVKDQGKYIHTKIKSFVQSWDNPTLKITALCTMIQMDSLS